MARIFISHSSSDNFEAVALTTWLGGEGWTDVFLDLHPEAGIAPGEKWERALHEAASRCEAVIFLVSANWLGSTWCLKEYGLARGLNKKLFAVLVDPTKTIADMPSELTGTWQAVDLVGGQDLQLFSTRLEGSHEEKHVGFSRSGLIRLKRGLEKAGLDPKFFAWPPALEPDRTPYRGLKPIEANDAGIFFGREAAIVQGRDVLRGLAAADKPRLLVILGASGAGKSSFLRAGLMPRLERDDGNVVPLAVIRPEHAALYGETGLLKALGNAFPGRSLASLRPAVTAGAAGLKPLLRELAEAARQRRLEGDEAGRPPMVVIAVDQAEELFPADAGDEGRRLLEIIGELVADDDPPVIAIFAIRSDAYDALEHAKPFEGMPQSTLPLLPMPRAAYTLVIEGPAARYRDAGHRLDIDPRLTLRILEDIEDGSGSDALPLLALMMEQLFLEYHQEGEIRLAHYEALDGLKGVIDAAVTRAFRRANRDPRIPADRQAREALLRRGLIPWLAGIDPETRKVRRNIARLSDIPPEAAPLIDLLKEERLLSSDRVKVEDQTTGVESWLVTVEPTHEALLRQWGLLDGWLKEDFGLLAALEGVKRGTRDWNANGRDDTWLVHRGQRLADARALDQRADIAARLDDLDHAYLARCEAVETAARLAKEEEQRRREEAQARELRDARAIADAEGRAARRTRIGLFAALTLVAIVGVVAVFWLLQWRKTGEALVDTQAALAIGASETSLRNGQDEAAVKDARKAFDLRPSTESRTALLSALLAVSPHLDAVRSVEGRNGTALAWVDADTVAVGLDTGDVVYEGSLGMDPAASRREPSVTVGNKGVLLMMPHDDGLIVVQADGRAQAISKDASTSWFDPRQPIEAISSTSAAAAIGGDGRTLAVALASGGLAVLRHDKSSRSSDTTRIGGDTSLTAVALSPDAAHWAGATDDGTILIGDTASAAAGTPLPVRWKAAALSWSPDGHFLAAGAIDGHLAIIDMTRPDRAPIIGQFSNHSPLGLAWRPQGDMLALPCGHVVCLWQPTAAAGPCGAPPVLRLSGHASDVRAIAWSRNGAKLASLDMGNAVRLWTLAADSHVRTVLDCADAGRIAALAASDDGTHLFAGAETGDAFAWTWPKAMPRRLAKSDGASIAALALDPDGRLAAARDDGTLTIWADGPAKPPADLPVATGGHLAKVGWLAAEKRWAVLESDRGAIALVDPAKPPPAGVRQACPTDENLLAEAFAPDRTAHRLYASFTKHLGVCDLDAGRWLAPIAIPGDKTVAAQSLATSVDGRWLAKSGGGDDYATLIDLAAPTNPQRLPTDRRGANAVAFSPDSRRLAVMANDGSVGIWSLEHDVPARKTVTIDNVAALPDRRTEKAQPSAMAWLGSTKIAIATSAGSVVIVDLDVAAWVRRADQLDGKAAPAPK